MFWGVRSQGGAGMKPLKSVIFDDVRCRGAPECTLFSAKNSSPPQGLKGLVCRSLFTLQLLCCIGAHWVCRTVRRVSPLSS